MLHLCVTSKTNKISCSDVLPVSLAVFYSLLFNPVQQVYCNLIKVTNYGVAFQRSVSAHTVIVHHSSFHR